MCNARKSPVSRVWRVRNMRRSESRPFQRGFRGHIKEPFAPGRRQRRQERPQHFLQRATIGGMLEIRKDHPLVGKFFILPLEGTSYMSGAMVRIFHDKSMNDGRHNCSSLPHPFQHYIRRSFFLDRSSLEGICEDNVIHPSSSLRRN